jgi:hypothetical protein
MRSTRKWKVALLVTGLVTMAAREALAIIGRPFTPMSYAGVARRTARRSYYYGAAGAYGYGYGAPYYDGW